MERMNSAGKELDSKLGSPKCQKMEVCTESQLLLTRIMWFFSLRVKLELKTRGGGSRARIMFAFLGMGHWEGSVGVTVVPSTKLCTICSRIGKGKVREGANGNSPFKDNFN